MSTPNPNEREPLEFPAGMRVAQEIDARALASPLPILRAHRALRGMAPGEILKVVTAHAQTVPEFAAMVKHVADYELVSQEEAAGEYVHLLRRRR